MADWAPGASLETLRARALMLAQVRSFFAARGVLEVETPLLCTTGVTDPLQSLLLSGERVLQTSPEYAMKRLLAAGSGPIYQLCKAFRDGESGSRHNPEFSILEWYRPGYGYRQLMDEVADLLKELLGREVDEVLSYRQLFERHLGIDPLRASENELSSLAQDRLDTQLGNASRDTWLNLLLSELVEPQLQSAGVVFVYDYPASQSALAITRGDVCERFEVYIDGLELANGYGELVDAAEQRARFEADNQQLEALGRRPRELDEKLLAALQSGLPACAGVALGVDRLLMIGLGLPRIEQTLSFSWHRA